MQECRPHSRNALKHVHLVITVMSEMKETNTDVDPVG